MIDLFVEQLVQIINFLDDRNIILETHQNLPAKWDFAPLNLYNKIICLENIFDSWDEFRQGKRRKIDVLEFEENLEDNLFALYRELKNRTYRHSDYTAFYITDPKLRLIHKAEVRDRVVHHAIYRVLYPIFDRAFIHDSYSCRIDKGTHRAVNRLESFIRKVSKNYTGPCFVLKCDIKKFFYSVDHQILLEIIKRKITNPDTLALLQEINGSFGGAVGRGIPIGNLTSQLFANIYMNEFDQFVKHTLKIKHYCRYTDDFVIVSENYKYLEDLLPQLELFLESELKLKLHPEKVSIRKYRQGVDFLGYVVLPQHRVLRTKTKNRIFKKLKQKFELFKGGVISEKSLQQSLNSYLGVLSHADTYQLRLKLLNKYWFWLFE